MRVLIYLIFIFFLAIAISGCAVNENTIEPAKYYYKNPQHKLSDSGRIALVELENETSYPQMSKDVTDALFHAIQKKQVFGLSVIRQTDPLWKSLLLKPDTTYTLDQMAAIRDTMECDGVLIGTITEFEPYPHMSIGLRLRIVDLTKGELLWAAEHIWNCSDKITQQKIKRYYQETQGNISGTMNDRLATISQLEFLKYISYELAQTL